MDQLVQCPVCTLFLHNGMSLESHLDTHPKDQVIKALCSLSKNANYDSRTPTPRSERSYRSRSRTPATDDSGARWNSSRNSDRDHYWRRTPNTPRSPKTSNPSRDDTPVSDDRLAELSYQSNVVNNTSQFSGHMYPMRAEKNQQSYAQPAPLPDYEQYGYYPEPQEDREIKYSRSAEYNAIDNTNILNYEPPPVATNNVKIQDTVLPPTSRKATGLVKILPKANNVHIKSNMGNMQYVAQTVKPVHMMMPPTPTFVQKNVHQSNLIMTGTMPASQIIDNRGIAPVMTSNQFNQLTTGTFTPGTTVVTQNSQIIYREMVHNIDGKPFMPNMPVLNENITNVAQTSSLYQNVMVVDPFGNTSCMYAPPQQLIATSKHTSCPVYNNVPHQSAPEPNESKKTLIIEVGPIMPPRLDTITLSESSSSSPQSQYPSSPKPKRHRSEKHETRSDSGSTKGLKILSNIKVEVPVQHSKNMLNTIMDLTGPNESDCQSRPISPEKINTDYEDNKQNISECAQTSGVSSGSIPNAFSVIKNVGNPPSYKDSIKQVESKIENEFSDSNPMPDLICNEKPSISPCSELSEQDNSTDRAVISPKPQPKLEVKTEKAKLPPRVFSNPLRLNNIFVKKNKKILEIKNSKKSDNSSMVTTGCDPIPSSSKAHDNFTITSIKPGFLDNNDNRRPSPLTTVSIEKIKENDFDADTEEQSMDIETPVPPSNKGNQFATSINIIQVKEEINTSNEGGFSNEACDNMAPLEALRPINVITYGNMNTAEFDDESNHRELLELEAASKNKQFVSMMNENYFGDNIYADYFQPDRGEGFERGSYTKEVGKEVSIWGEPSVQKESEFVLPSFIHESYKIAESAVEYPEGGESADCERDSKADVMSEERSRDTPLDICADERMPPRGELSGESNGDMESSWNGMYAEANTSEPYDLMARESWVSDGSEVDATEKRENLDDEIRYGHPLRAIPCPQCPEKLPSSSALRAHRLAVHSERPACIPATYAPLERAIKKEERTDDTLPSIAGSMLESKDSITATMMQVYNDVMAEAKPKIEGLIKQEAKRRRKDYVCPTCKVDQLSEPAFHEHLKIHPLECLTCGKCFFRRANLALHIKTHLGIKNYKCDVCEKRFMTRQKLMEHHNVHTGRAPIKCTLCDDTFRRYSNMLQHRDRHHFQKKSKVRDYVCQCGAIFHSRAKLIWHKETHDERPKACLYCSDKFVHAASLTRHVRRTHNEYYLSERNKGKVDNVPCPVCKQVYLRTNLRAHLQTHSGKRPYLCIVCNKSFTTKWNLKLHRWTHMSRSAKPFKCSLCKGAFIRHTEFIAHMNAHKSVRPYTCNYCGCQFIRKYNCQRHVREHEMAKKYVCKVPECGKSFHRSYYLSEHMKVHSGARPFSCSICGKTSSNKSNHNKHVKIHHAREPVATEA